MALDRNRPGYILLFVAAVCVVCAVFVATSAVGLAERQEENALLDRQQKVLSVAGLLDGAPADPSTVRRLFDSSIEPVVVNLEDGSVAEGVDPSRFDQRREARDPAHSHPAPPNPAQVLRLPDRALIYLVREEGELRRIVLPVEGKGLWSTLYGYLALAPDARTIEGLVFYQHAETPGLGGEIDNPRWLALFPGRLAYDDAGEPAIEVKKGPAGPVAEDPYHVDGISGATLTSRGVTHLLQFWLGDAGFGPTLDRLRVEGGGGDE